MKLATTRFGELEVLEEDIITFPKGILGFGEYKKYIMIPADDKQETPFFFLQSAEEGDLNFFILSTFSFFQEYDFELDEATVRELKIENPKDVIVFTIVTAKGSLKDATTNLKAPVIVNTKNNKAKQVVLEKGDFLIKQPLFDSEKKPKLTVVKG